MDEKTIQPVTSLGGSERRAASSEMVRLYVSEVLPSVSTFQLAATVPAKARRRKTGRA